MSRIATMSLGPVPSEEACAQLGVTFRYHETARLEALCHRAALIARYGPPPAGFAMRALSNQHDFGTYIDLVAVFDQSDEVHRDYLLRVEQGLSTWIDAGFLPPILYDDRSQSVEATYTDHFHAALRVIVTLERQRIDGHGSPVEASAIAHLRAEYPAQAEQADQLLRQIASEDRVRGPEARRVGLYAPYRLTFYPALFNEARGTAYLGDGIDVTARELRTGRHRYIQCDIGTVPTLDDALSLCWEHLARYVIA
ncbi:hypothetical protein [Sphingomonas oryzagri]